MNSFFASVEQQENPDLRGRPVGITAVDSNSGCCVAASVEAKRFGVKTGTHVREAKRLCPGIVLLPSRHRLYVSYNLRVAAILDSMAELERIRSVDEFQLRLSGETSELAVAEALVRAMKTRVAREVGPAIRFSAGIGPNPLLAKIAGKLEKPDGFQWLSSDNLPQRIAHLKPQDLPGISGGIGGKLERAGITDCVGLFRLDPRHARMIWGSIEGERFVRALQGEDVPVISTQRNGYGNGKVLSPNLRKVKPAYLVGRWLVGKSTSRMRRDGRVASVFALSLAFENGGGWSASIRCQPSCDTLYFLGLHRDLWRRALAQPGPRSFLSIGINLSDVALLQDRTGDMLEPIGPAEKTRGEVVSSLVDQINRRFGSETVRFGVDQPHPGFFERG